MDESTIGREPVEIVEVITPKCVNVHGTSPCTATQTGSAKCFNTRVTCNDADNYQARPAAHLVADQIYEQGDTFSASEIDRTDDFFFKTEVFFPASPDGCIFEVGGSVDGSYLGVTAGELIWRTGDGGPSASGGTNTGRIAVPSASFAGKTLTLYGEVDFVASGSCSISLWAFDPIELVLTLLGTDTYTAAGSTWSGGDDGGVGTINTLLTNGESAADFNGTITTFNAYNNQADPGLDTSTEAYRQRYFFDDGRKAIPSDKIYIVPLLVSVSTVGSRINVGGTDERYEPLGRRAFADIQFSDAPHSDYPFDPYRTDRGYDPLKRSTFWAKWLQRNRYGKTRAIVRRYSGYNGQSLAQMRRQTYVLDRADWARESLSMRCRDFLSLTEFRRAQVPAPSPGSLATSILAADTSFTMNGDQRNDYPATGGTLRIDEELMLYTGVSYDSGSDTTTISGLTRGTDGSTAVDHDDDESVQLCRRYTAARIDDVITEFMVTDAAVPAQVVDLAELTAMYDASLNAYQLTTLISEPTGVDQLIGEIAEQCSFYVWWNERDQITSFQAIQPLESVDRELTQEGDIIADTMEVIERPKERITTISLLYNPRNFAGDLEKPTNFKNQLVVSNSNASGPDQYGVLPQTRELFSRWLTTEAQMNQTGSRYSIRYVDVPQYATFMIDAKDRDLWVGDFITISHDHLVFPRGERDLTRRWLIIEAEETEPGHAQRITCVDVTLDGRIYFITTNALTTYTLELSLLNNAFITDNAGLNADGTVGTTIG